MKINYTTKLITVSLCLITLFSCVSKKKYKQLVKDYNSLDSTYANLNSKYNSLFEKNSEDKQLSQAELQKLYDQLKAKVADLEASNKKVQDLQAGILKQKQAQQELLAKVKNALVGFNANELTAELRSDGKVYVSLSEKLLFKSGSYKVDPKGKDALKKLADVLIHQPDIDITIEGHTDNVPLKKGEFLKDNLDLSVMRATSIERILYDDYGVSAQQMYASGRGENFPIASNETEEGRAANRRTEIILSPKISELFKIIDQN
ncbi:MAG TPA: OmpA family protein [Bacteroidia bacterium]|nr:OmpA family protein [Bacteroidia bacterium]